MANVFDYLSWRGDLTFEQVPFSETDALVLALISYIDFEGIVSGKQGGTTISLEKAAKVYFAQRPDREKISLGVLVPKEIVNLLEEACKTRRFSGLQAGGFINHISEEEGTQFCAMTFFLDDGKIAVVYRGTDDTIVGWRENCNLSFCTRVPAQSAAAAYLDEMARLFPGRKLLVAGHSKGGNLAAAATFYCKEETFGSVLATYNLDGPGSLMEHWYGEEQFAARCALIKTFVPEHSIVGLLLEHDPNLTPIKSSQVGILQHNGLSWGILGATFVRADSIGKDARKTCERLNNWVKEMTPERRREVVDAIFSIFSASGALTLTELVAQKSLWIQKCKELDPAVYSTLEEVFFALLKPQKKKEAKNFFLEVFKK